MGVGMKIGILTSGGDCAGLNAVIRAAVHRAEYYGHEMYGIHDGTMGLLERPLRYEILSSRTLGAAMMRAGGTILGTTNRGNPFAHSGSDGSTRDCSADIAEGVKMLGLDAIIGIGGDGSFSILRRLAKEGGFNIVGVPKTIDNDIGMTELSVGFDTAIGVATEALDRLQPTAASHARIMVLEVMGRDAGHIALSSGIAGGADVILIPEIPYDLERIAAHMARIRQSGRNHALVVVSEAVRTADGRPLKVRHPGGAHRFGGIGQYIAHNLAELTGAETRVTVLGHVQRGSQPSAVDRLVASAFGVHAVDLIQQGKFDRMVAWQNRDVIDVPLAMAIAKYQTVDIEGTLVRTARALNICMGD
jgi:6-phosphofructokinase 1